MNYDVGDILIILSSSLRKLDEQRPVIRFAALDQELEFDEGTTKRHLHQAAEKAGFRIVDESTNLAELQRLPTRIQRG